MTAAIVAVVVVLVAALWVVVTFNRLVSLRNLVAESWRQIDVELHRRHDLVPNLVETVRAYAVHERTVLEDVVRLRAAAAAPGATPAQQAEQEGALGGALSRLVAVAEGYPELKSSANFVELQRQLAETEDRIAAGRRFYNANVRSLNTAVESVPSNLVASWFGFGHAEYFELTDPGVRAVPAVDFGALGTSSVAGSLGPAAAAPTASPAAAPATAELPPDSPSR